MVRALARVRSSYPTLKVEAVNGAPQQRLAKIVKSMNPRLSFSDLRMMYALVMFEAERPHTQSINAFIKRVLGHGTLSTSVSYTKMRIVDMVKALEEI